jgi:proteic killer suppression protein
VTGVTVYVILKAVIKTFRNRDAAGLYASGISRRFQKCARQAFQKLRMLDAARTLGDLSALPDNRLEALGGDRRGQYSIRVSDRYRICFVWRDGDAHDVEITDYH